MTPQDARANRIVAFDPAFAAALPETHALLRSAQLTVHPAVERIVLHGSRGLAGGFRPDSDVDLSLLVDTSMLAAPPDLEPFLHDVLATTLDRWRGAVEADLAVIFEQRGCALHCFDHSAWSDGLCTIGGVDCFGLYKTQRGFNGLVTNAGVEVKRMYPSLKIWQRV